VIPSACETQGLPLCGNMSVKGANQEMGAPSNGHLIEAFHTAKEILRRAPNEPQIFEEDQVDELVSQIEDEIRAMDHSAGAHPT
jgi:hypothetical protein